MCGETRDRVGFGPLPQGPRNSPPLPPYIQPLGHCLDFGFCLDQKFAIVATSRTSFVFNDQTKASQNPTFINKAFLFYSQYLDCNLSFLLVLCLLAGKQTLVVRLIMLQHGQYPLGVGLVVAKARCPRTFVVGSSKSTSTKAIPSSHRKTGHLCLYQVVSDFQVAR